MATLMEIAILNWVTRSSSELSRREKRFRNQTILELLFWKRVAEMYGKQFSF